MARMYCGALGKTGNCQIGVSVHAVTDWASAAIDWRLFLPESWDDEKAADDKTAAEIRAAGPAARSRTRCGTGRSGGWRWTCSTRSPASGACPRGRWSLTQATEMPPSSGSG